MRKLLLVLVAMTLTTSAFGSMCATLPSDNNMLNGLPNPDALQNPSSGTYDPCTLGMLTISNISYDLEAGEFMTSSPAVSLYSLNPGPPVEIEYNPDLASGSALELEFEITGNVNSVSVGFDGAAAGSNAFIDELVCTVFTSTGVSGMASGDCPVPDTLATLVVDVVTPSASSLSLPTSGPVWIFQNIQTASDPFGQVLDTFDVAATPAPELVTMLSMGGGLLGLGILRRKRLALHK